MMRGPAAEPDRLYDPGLQPERTALAIAVGSLLSLRIFPYMLPAAAGAWALAPAAIGLCAACLLWFAARRRQLRVTAVLTDAAPGRPRAERCSSSRSPCSRTHRPERHGATGAVGRMGG